MNQELFKFRPACLALALFCFVLPFFTISCPGGSYSLTGIEAAIGTTIEGQRVQGDALGALALLAALVAFGLALIKSRQDVRGVSVAAGGTGVLFLLLLASKASSEVAKYGHGFARFSTSFGYWLCLIGLTAGSVLGYLEWKSNREGVAQVDRPATEGGGAASVAPTESDGT